MKISPEEFIKAWQTSDSAIRAAEKTGMTYSGCTSRACWYRKRGIPLKTFRQGRFALNVKSLTTLAKSFNGK